MIETKEGFQFETTGRSFYANGYIGIYENKDGLIEISQGYDGHISPRDKEGEIDDIEPGKMSVEEKTELAYFMIEKWKKFAGIETSVKFSIEVPDEAAKALRNFY